MDDEDRFSASSGESERENGVEEAADAVEDEHEQEADEGNNDDDEEDEGETYGEAEDMGDEGTQKTSGAGEQADGQATQASKTSDTAAPDAATTWSTAWASGAGGWPSVLPEALTAKMYDIVPTMAAPQATSINAMAITPDLRYWLTGGSDGYIRKYDGPSTINGKLALTVAQRHPFVDSVTKAGVLMSYWENEEPAGRNGTGGEHEQVLSPVYSLAVHSRALWLLSGLESGGINLQSVRHDEGKKICCLQQHSNAVSVLTLAPDEKSVLSGSWDKSVLDWDLNVGVVKRRFDGIGGQVSSIELRPASGAPVAAETDEPMVSSTMMSGNGRRVRGAFEDGGGGGEEGGEMEGGGIDGGRFDGEGGQMREAEASPAHESLFGGSDAGSLFGETTGEQPFGHDDDGYGESMDMMGGHDGGDAMDLDMGMGKEEGESGHNNSTTGDAMDVDVPGPERDEEKMDGGDKMDGDKMDEEKMNMDKMDEEKKIDMDKRAMDETATQSNEPQPNDSLLQAEDKPTQRDDDTPNGTRQQHDAAQDTTPPSKHEARGTASRSQSRSSPDASSPPHYDPCQMSPTTFLSSAIDGTIRIWDRRVPGPVARIGTRAGVPPWCMSAAWSPDGNVVYAGRRNGTVEEYDVRRARRGWEPDRTLKLPGGSGAVSAVKPMVNGRHLVCASHDIMRLYDLRESRANKHSVPFLVIPGPPRAGVIAGLYVDPTSRFMLSAAGTRGWEGTCTEVLIGYEITSTPG